jgi:hypothetical protein
MGVLDGPDLLHTMIRPLFLGGYLLYLFSRYPWG